MREPKKILLVDSDPAERAEITRVLERVGYRLIPVEDGAVAINKAIAEPPDMIITAVEMSLVDGFKLCQLLRSNPATQGIPFVFLTEKETNPRNLGEFIRPVDDFILKPFKGEELLGRVNNLFYRRDKVHEVAVEADRSVAGTLTEIALVDLLQIFKMNRKTGVLSVKSDGQSGMVFIRDGTVINARLGKVSGPKAIFRLVTWQRGTFEFKPGVAATEVKIHQPTENIVMEGLRQFDELNRVSDKLPPRRAVLRLMKSFKGPESKLRPVTREVLKLLGYFTRVEDVLDNATFPDLEVYETLMTLIDHGVVEVMKEEESLPAGAISPLLGLEESLKIGYFLGVGQGETRQQWSGKALIFAQGPDHLGLFLERARVLPDFRLEDEAAEDPREYAGIGIKASISIMDTISIIFLSLPARAGFEPLWRAFRPRALGAILLGTAGVEGDAVFAPVAAFLRAEGIPFAAVSVEAPGEVGGAPAGGPSPLPWLALDPNDAAFARRSLRAFFEVVLAR